MDNDLLTAREAAQMLRCNERTIRRKIGDGQLAGVMAAGRWLVPREAIDTYLAPPPRRPQPTDDFSALAAELLESR